MSNNFADLGVADYLTLFADATEFLDRVISKRQFLVRNIWRGLMPRGTYSFGEGLTRKIHRFHPGIGDQSGLNKWRAIAVSSVASGNNPGVDACAYEPYLIQSGADSIEYSGMQTERRTEHICVNDIANVWEFRQQLDHMLSFLADVTNSVWENYNREMYMKFAADYDRAYVLCGGNPVDHTFTYDPTTADADGDFTLVADRGLEISTLEFRALQRYARQMEVGCPQAAISQESGRPVFGLVLDQDDFDFMIEQDDLLREAFLYAQPQVLIEPMGKVDRFRQFALTHDIFAPRFKIKSMTASKVTYRRVDPFLEQNADTGVKYVPNPEYDEAEFAVGCILIKDVFQVLVPQPGPSNPGGGTSFGTTPSLNGEFRWINIPNEKTNLLSEVGFYFGRYKAYAKPLVNYDQAVCFLYRRCAAVAPKRCETAGTAADSATLVKIATSSSYTHDSDSTLTATITLTGPIGGEAGDEVTLYNDADSTTSVIIAESSDAPTYKVLFQTAAARVAEADMNDTAHAGLKWTA